MTPPDFGFLAVDKPSGPTSHDIVSVARRVCGTRKIGHGGTLDPLAEGLLVLAIGEATRLLEYVTHSNKSYQARILFGIATTTDDLEGQVTSRLPIPAWLNVANRLEDLLDEFRGDSDQVPPAYSAVKVDGRRAYQRARADEHVELAPRAITIFEMTATDVQLPYVDLFIQCSAGTYIRSLAREIGKMAGCGAVLAHLRRISVGHITTDDAISWIDFTSGNESGKWRECLLPASRVLSDLSRVDLTAAQVDDIRHGRAVYDDDVESGTAGAYSPSGKLLALVNGDSERGVWKPAKVFPGQFT